MQEVTRLSELIKFEVTVSYRLARATTAFRNALERRMGVIGLHGGQIFILFELWNSNGRTQVDLARSLGVSAPTINKMVKGLIEIGLVTRNKIDDDGRSTRIFLTPQGYSIRSEIEAQWLELEEYCLSGLTETERLVLFDLLGKLKSIYTGRADDGEEE